MILWGLLASLHSFSQAVGINTNGPADANSLLEVRSTNKGILIPRIDYNNRPLVAVPAGMLIYVTANGPNGNNSFYHFNGTSWGRFYNINEVQTLSLSNDSLYIIPGNVVDLGNLFPVAGFIKCGYAYYNPLTDNNHCGSCIILCSSGKTCINGSCQ